MGNLQAVVVVSFGTSHIDALEKNIAWIEHDIGKAFPNHTQYRAFTSESVIQKLQEQENIMVDDVPQALSKLKEKGYDSVILQPTHIIYGKEYDKLCKQAAPFTEYMKIQIGAPLMCSIADIRQMASALMSLVDIPAIDEAIVWIGHGTGQEVDATYNLLEDMLHDMGWNQVYVGTIKGKPAFSDVLCKLQANSKIRKVRLHLLMVTVGMHAEKDIAGQKHSWSAWLQEKGYQVSCVLHGLGECTEIRNLWIQHALTAKSLEVQKVIGLQYH